MSSIKSKGSADAVVLCCSYDLRVCDHACDLIKSGKSEKLIISGNTGNWTKHIWAKTESSIFKERAIQNGIDPQKISLETKATNFGENVLFSKKIIPEAQTVIFVSKPNSLLRVKLTVESQWPEIKSYVSCPDIEFPNQVSNVVGVLGVINEMVGDIERIQKYPEMGFQIHHKLPESILDSWSYLIAQGFTEHMVPNKSQNNAPSGPDAAQDAAPV